jgi:hypothetical protein
VADVEGLFIFQVFVKRNNKLGMIRLREDKIAFWAGHEDVIEEMTENGFKRLMAQWEDAINYTVFLTRYNFDGEEIGTVIVTEEKHLSEGEMMGYWKEYLRASQADISNIYYLTFETFLGDRKFRFKREGDEWIRIE